MPIDRPKLMKVVQNGQAQIEGIQINCAVGENLHVYIPIVQICYALQIPYEIEEERILSNAALVNGTVMMEFSGIENGKEVRRLFLSINLTRLHTWLAGIPTESVPEISLRSKLAALQNNLADLVYAYFGRPLMPTDILAEQETNLPEETKKRYATIEQLQQAETTLADLQDRVVELEVIIAGKEVGDFITRQQRQQFKKMVNHLGKILEEKVTGDILHVHQALKEQFKYDSYKVITVEEWPVIVNFCAQWFRRLSPPGKPLPSHFQIVQQNKMW